MFYICVIFGELFLSVLVDYYGLFWTKPREVGRSRIMGVLLVLSGVITFQLELLNLKERESFIEALGTSATSIVCGMALVVQSSFNQRIGLILGDMRGAPVISTFIGSVLSLVANITLLPEYKIQSEKFSCDNLWLWTGGMIGSFGLCCVTY